MEQQQQQQHQQQQMQQSLLDLKQKLAQQVYRLRAEINNLTDQIDQLNHIIASNCLHNFVYDHSYCHGSARRECTKCGYVI